MCHSFLPLMLVEFIQVLTPIQAHYTLLFMPIRQALAMLGITPLTQIRSVRKRWLRTVPSYACWHTGKLTQPLMLPFCSGIICTFADKA